MSIKNMSRLPFATLAVVLATVPLWGQEPQKQRLEIEIEKVALAKYGYEVSIRLKNVSATAVKLARTGGAASPMLQSLDVQQWDEKLGWQSVGPCRDVPPRTMITISPQQQLEDVVPIGDLERLV